MITIILDTNFLMYCAKYKIDYESEISRLINEKHKIVISDQVLDEMEDLADSMRGKERATLELAKNIVDDKIKRNKIEAKETASDNADYSVIKLAMKSEKPIIASIDRELRNEAIKRLKNAQFLTIKQKTHLQIV